MKLNERMVVLYNVALVMIRTLPNGWPVAVPRSFSIDLEIYMWLNNLDNEHLVDRLMELNG